MLILQVLYFFLPAYLANSIPVLVRNWNFLSYPVDFGMTYRGKRILGDHKTIRGFLFGSLYAVLVYLLQVYLYSNFDFFKVISLFDYSSIHCSYGFLLGFGALLGDAIESFFKRQLNIPSGQMLWFFDQTDFVFGALLLTAPLYFPGIKVFLVLLLVSGLLSFLSHRFAYILKLINTKN